MTALPCTPGSRFSSARNLAARAAMIAGLAFSALAFAPAASTSVYAQTAANPPAAGSPSSGPQGAGPQSGPSAGGAPAAADPQGATPTSQSLLKPEWLQTLQQYGSFFNHARYGEVWKPSVTPKSWHPYPACFWKNTRKFGWYFDDPTPWGKIVHHYGRWTNDTEHGWIWVPGKEFSSGWVIWRTSNDYIGWMPQIPDQDVKEITSEQINKSGQWIFMDAKKFGKKCTEILPASQQPVLVQKTKFVTDIRFVDGIGVFVLPDIFTGPYVNISVIYTHWPIWFFHQWVVNINWIWTTIEVIFVQNCGPFPLRR